MKKNIILFFVICLFSSAIIAQDNMQPLQKAQQMLEWIKEGKGEDEWNMCTPEVQNHVTADAFSKMWRQLQSQVGKFESEGEWKTGDIGGMPIYYVDLKFANYTLQYVIVFNEDGLCSGIHFKPAPSQQMSYEGKVLNNDKIEEKDIVINSGKFQLPGTLSMPKDITSDVPIVILVHGSGPHDRNETVGPLKPFQELAWGLAEQGIAVMRYDKRTFVYGGASLTEKDSFTYDDEVVDDAIAAAELAKTLTSIDANRVYVLGHSLGGTLVPRIAEKAGDTDKLAGIISVAGVTRNMNDVLIEQITYLASLNGQQVDAKKEAEKIMNSLPQSYRDFELVYNPVETAKKLKLPILILQGERDYQVTMEDFGNWRMGLMRNRNVQFKSYPKLNHMLQEGVGKSTPLEYNNYAQIPEYVIIDIANFINDKFEQ